MPLHLTSAAPLPGELLNRNDGDTTGKYYLSC